MAKPTDFQRRSIDELELSPKVSAALAGIQVELVDAYRSSFVAMVDAMNKQASALGRIQNTLNILIERLAPQLSGQVPPAIGIVDDSSKADLARAVVVADPIGRGYTLSKTSLAKALGISASNLSVLSKAFKLDEDGACAVTVRKGKRHDIVNYHPRAVAKFKRLAAKPPAGMDRAQQNALNRALVEMANLTVPSMSGAEAREDDAHKS
jgi:hypothetical protein